MEVDATPYQPLTQYFYYYNHALLDQPIAYSSHNPKTPILYNMEKNELFLKHAWRFATLPTREEGILVWNSQREQLYKVPPFVFNKLVQMDLYNTDSLDEAIKQITKEKSWSPPVLKAHRLPHQACFTMLGYPILVRCKYKKCLQDIKDYFSYLVQEFPCSPDIIVDCDWKRAEPYLFVDRTPGAQTDPLIGVRVHSFGKMATEDWAYASPPIPPLCIPPFKDQFVGIHAALVLTPAGKGLMIVGASGAGKTTCSTELTNNHGCSFMTDELVLIHKRTALAEPFSRPLGIKSDGGPDKKFVFAKNLLARIHHKAALITHMVLLEQGIDKQGWSPGVSVYETLVHLLKQHQDAGCNNDESIVTLMQLANTVPAARFGYQGYEELKKACALFFDFTRQTC